jgi:hypothetical protein
MHPSSRAEMLLLEKSSTQSLKHLSTSLLYIDIKSKLGHQSSLLELVKASLTLHLPLLHPRLQLLLLSLVQGLHLAIFDFDFGWSSSLVL